MKYQNLSLSEVSEIKTELLREGIYTPKLDHLMDFHESELVEFLLEDTGGPSGAAGAATIGIGGGGVAYANASNGGMGQVVSSQASTSAGVTTEPGYSLTGGKIGSGDVGFAYNTGGTKMFQKIPVDNRKGTNRRRKNKMLAQLKGAILKRNDFTAGQGIDKPKRLMNFDTYSKDELSKVTKVKQ